MRKILIAVSVVLLISCSGRDTIRIQGNFIKAANKIVCLDEVDINNSINLDSAKVNKGGEFSFKFTTAEPSYYQLKISENNFITLLAEPGENIYIESDESFLPNGYTIKGSGGSTLIKRLDDRLFKTQVSLDSIIAAYKSRMDEEGFDTLESELNEKYSKVVNQQRRFTIQFILNNISSLASIKALYQKYDSTTYVLNDIKDLQYLKIVADSLKVYYPDSKHTRALITDLNNEMDRFNAQRMSELVTNSASSTIEIELPTPEGDTISLSSLHGKYVLLSFWASWDEASVGQNIELKRLYNQYKSRGFEIYQVSFDSDPEAWKQAIRFDDLPWINVSDLRYPNSPVVSMFNIQKLPANYLLNKEGEIVGKDFTGRTLKIKLTQLFN